jgi:hypothetical protein
MLKHRCNTIRVTQGYCRRVREGWARGTQVVVHRALKHKVLQVLHIVAGACPGQYSLAVREGRIFTRTQTAQAISPRHGVSRLTPLLYLQVGRTNAQLGQVTCNIKG